MNSPESHNAVQPPKEIERKFRLDLFPENLKALCYKHDYINQGYIAIEENGTEVRLRHQSGDRTLTVKTGGGLVRSEVEVALSDLDFGKLWPLTEGRRIEKIRYTLPIDHLKVEIDVYQGSHNGLIVAEVEFPDEDAAYAFVAPQWFGAEVTQDKSFKNQQLALHGLPSTISDSWV